jgi:multiple sugar transport system permease protein
VSRELRSTAVSPAAPPVQRNAWVHVVLAIVMVVCVLPLVWIVLTAFMSRETAQSVPPQWIFTPSLDAFRTLIREYGLLRNLLNTTLIAAASTFFSVTIGMFCAYALARFDFAGKEDVSFWILTNRMMPAVAVILPVFLIFQTLALLDSFIGLVALYTAMQLPFVVWMLKGYFDDVPRELEEIALVDGDTWFGAFRRDVLPVMAPAITATAIFVLILSWNEYAFALYLTGTQTKTLPVSVVTFAVQTAAASWDILGAACLIISTPILLFVIAVQKQFIKGLSMGMVR